MPRNTCISIKDRHGFERLVPARATMVLGRQSQCDVVLPDSMVSRSHLRVERLEDGWWVEDLGSSHGTFFQEERVTRMLWPQGATLRLADGAYLLTLRGDGMEASEANLQAILQTANLLSGEVELDDLLEQTLERLLSISGTDRGFIMLPEHGDLVVKVQRNLGANMEQNIHLSMSSVQRVFDQGTPVWIHNMAGDEDVMAQKSVVDLQLKTILCLPLLVQGARIGVVYLDSRRIVTEPVDRATFNAIVALCAIAIERTRLSEQSMRNQVLATVGQVASSIVHDFKNGLFVIGGHAQLMAVKDVDPNAQHHLRQIIGTVDRLSLLSAEILEYSKAREPHCETVDLPAYLGGLLEPYQPRAMETSVSLRCAGPACAAFLDRHRFARVVENLVANSLDALAGQGGGQVTVAWSEDGDGVQITVTDTG